MSRIKRAKKALSLLPRWAYYVGSLFIGGPIGPVIVYLMFYALDKAEKDYRDEDEVEYYEGSPFARSGGAGAGTHASTADSHTVYGDDYTVRDDDGSERTGGYSFSRKTEEPDEEIDIPSFDSTDVNEIISAGHTALEMIHRANDRIPDPALSAQIDSIENSCRQILEILQQREELLPQLRTFLRYYLPTTLKLLNARAKLDRNASTPKAKEVRNRITNALGEVDTAFRKQVETLDEYRFVDLESEIDVLTDMLKADGLLDSEGNETQPLGAF
ncbi:MAG: 5-bromo-4-chloroindolyl phosphate hydrolysis family protein [Clostridia bacterium]|nr:5-bromo-4-chloroindolyl phosphate hydrolysis family protein [Clostridia bacterium]